MDKDIMILIGFVALLFVGCTAEVAVPPEEIVLTGVTEGDDLEGAPTEVALKEPVEPTKVNVLVVANRERFRIKVKQCQPNTVWRTSKLSGTHMGEYAIQGPNENGCEILFKYTDGPESSELVGKEQICLYDMKAVYPLQERSNCRGSLVDYRNNEEKPKTQEQLFEEQFEAAFKECREGVSYTMRKRGYELEYTLMGMKGRYCKVKKVLDHPQKSNLGAYCLFENKYKSFRKAVYDTETCEGILHDDPKYSSYANIVMLHDSYSGKRLTEKVQKSYSFGGSSSSSGVTNTYDKESDTAQKTKSTTTSNTNPALWERSCTDSDGGNNLAVKGVIDYVIPYEINTFYDSCIDSSGKQVGESNRIKELMCDLSKSEGAPFKYVMTDCPTGTTCKDGACIQKTVVQGTGGSGGGAGGIDIDVTVQGEFPGQAEFEQQFSVCESGASYTVDLGFASYNYKINGPERGMCKITTYYPNPPAPHMTGKMVCLYDNSKSFTQATSEASFGDTCSGALYDAFLNPPLS